MRRRLALLAALVVVPIAQAQPVPPDLRTVITARNNFVKLADIRSSIIRQLGFQEGAACVAPPTLDGATIDFHRTLFVHDKATLGAADFSLRRTLKKLGDDVGGSINPAPTPEAIFTQFMDTQNDAAHAVNATDTHCSDSNGKINGFPLNKCARPEGAEANGGAGAVAARIDNDYKPIALVNRIDLADKGWRNCGEHRIVYGSQTNGKNLIIFEAVLPNPKPGCQSGCRDVIEFWVGLSSDPNPASRAGKLEKFFYQGIPGFQEVVRTTHYTSGASSAYGGGGSGQIRTNQFISGGPWTLKEFKTFLSCSGGACDYDILPNTVKVNPYGVLWDRRVAAGSFVPPLPPANSFATAIVNLKGLADAFQGEVLAQVDATHLAAPSVSKITYQVLPDKNGAESQSQGPIIDDYLKQFGDGAAVDPSFKNNLQTAINALNLPAGSAPTPEQVVNRAMTNSCAGCHLPDGFGLDLVGSIGPNMKWPKALAFVHVDVPETSLAGMAGFNAANFGNNDRGFNISPALLGDFLPDRRLHLVDLANHPVCDCIPKPNLLSKLRASMLRQQRTLEISSARLKAELAETDKAFFARGAATPADRQAHLAAKRSLIAAAEAERDKALEKQGLALVKAAPKVEPVKLSATKLEGARLRAVKLNKLQEIVNAEPPRETFTGSFRVH